MSRAALLVTLTSAILSTPLALAEAQATAALLSRTETDELRQQPSGGHAAGLTFSTSPASVESQDSTRDRPDCVKVGNDWFDHLRKETTSRRESAFTAIVFSSADGPCNWSRDYGVVGDAIYVGILGDGATLDSISFEPCQLQPAAPALFISGSVPSVPPGLMRAGIQIRPFPPKRCFNSAVTITAKWTVDDRAITATYPLLQYERYRGTLQLGLTWTTAHDQAFGLRPEESANRIFDKGPTDSGPEYLVTLSLYALPKQVLTLFDRTDYAGRDIIHDQTIADRIGGLVGVGLRHAGRRFVAGVAFELLYGVNIIYVHEWALVKVLDGVRVGDPFTGGEAAIPIRDRWQGDWRWGISIDLRYATALFQRK
jgi:hypothetical protein